MSPETMNAMMLIMAKTMNEEEILCRLKQAIEEYEITKNEKSKSNFQFHLMLATTKYLTEGREISDVLKEMDKINRGRDLLNVNEQ